MLINQPPDLKILFTNCPCESELFSHLGRFPLLSLPLFCINILAFRLLHSGILWRIEVHEDFILIIKTPVKQYRDEIVHFQELLELHHRISRGHPEEEGWRRRICELLRLAENHLIAMSIIFEVN